VKIRDLALGTRFRYPECGKTATLMGLGESGARVQFDAANRVVEFEVKSGDEVVGAVAFERPGKPVLVSDYSDVEIL
jgi:hypothetical protein